jgi:uncharacterized Zn finger protein
VTAARGFPAFPPRPGRRGRSWWARAFTAAMEDAALDATLLRAGRRFAGSGRIGPITVSPGRIAATIEDPDGIYDVVVDPAAVTADVALLPTIGDLESDCDCPDIGDPCQHAAGLCYQAAWLLDDDPFVLLLLRGRDADELLDVLGREPAAPEPADRRDVDRVVAAAAAYTTAPAGLPAPLPPPARADVPVFPPPPGLPPDALSHLAAAAATRAKALLTGVPVVE